MLQFHQSKAVGNLLTESLTLLLEYIDAPAADDPSSSSILKEELSRFQLGAVKTTERRQSPPAVEHLHLTEAAHLFHRVHNVFSFNPSLLQIGCECLQAAPLKRLSDK